MKRPDKIKIEIIKAPALDFGPLKRSRGNSIYLQHIMQAVNTDKEIRILADDKYLLSQFKIIAKKNNISLVFAYEGLHLWIKPLLETEEYYRLIQWLREPRTVNELRSKKLELDLDLTLNKMASNGIANIVKRRAAGGDIPIEHWQLTEKGKLLAK